MEKYKNFSILARKNNKIYGLTMTNDNHWRMNAVYVILSPYRIDTSNEWNALSLSLSLIQFLSFTPFLPHMVKRNSLLLLLFLFSLFQRRYSPSITFFAPCPKLFLATSGFPSLAPHNVSHAPLKKSLHPSHSQFYLRLFLRRCWFVLSKYYLLALCWCVHLRIAVRPVYHSYVPNNLHERCKLI